MGRANRCLNNLNQLRGTVKSGWVSKRSTTVEAGSNYWLGEYKFAVAGPRHGLNQQCKPGKVFLLIHLGASCHQLHLQCNVYFNTTPLKRRYELLIFPSLWCSDCCWVSSSATPPRSSSTRSDRCRYSRLSSSSGGQFNWISTDCPTEFSTERLAI